MKLTCEVCKKRHGEKYEYEYRIRGTRTLICFCMRCLRLIMKNKIQAPAYIPNEQVPQYIVSKIKKASV